MTTYVNIAQVRQANKAAGDHWFSADTLRFFGSEVYDDLYDGRYFVTSEYTGFDKTGRAFTVREARPDGTIRTVSEFLGHASLSDAIAAAETLAKEGP